MRRYEVDACMMGHGIVNMLSLNKLEPFRILFNRFLEVWDHLVDDRIDVGSSDLFPCSPTAVVGISLNVTWKEEGTRLRQLHVRNRRETLTFSSICKNDAGHAVLIASEVNQCMWFRVHLFQEVTYISLICMWSWLKQLFGWKIERGTCSIDFNGTPTLRSDWAIRYLLDALQRHLKEMFASPAQLVSYRWRKSMIRA